MIELGGFYPDGPTPDPLWQEILDEMFQPFGKRTWLHLYWDPGYKHIQATTQGNTISLDPVNRWMIGQVTPRGNIPPMYLEWFAGPNPAILGEFFQGEWRSTAPPISRKQWSFFHETGCLLQPYWIVQGTKGGHRYRLSNEEQTILEIKNGQKENPYPGQLPFATPDRRTFNALARSDLIRVYATVLDQAGDLVREETAKEMRQAIWDHHDAQSEEAAEHASSQAARELWQDMPTYEEAYEGEASIEQKLEELEESYINEGT